MYSSKLLECKDCGQTFEFSAGEQEFFAKKGFTHEPVRCRECRTQRRNRNRPENRQLFEAVCSNCGETAQVPFEPVASKPVYCGRCFQDVRKNRKQF